MQYHRLAELWFFHRLAFGDRDGGPSPRSKRFGVGDALDGPAGRSGTSRHFLGRYEKNLQPWRNKSKKAALIAIPIQRVISRLFLYCLDLPRWSAVSHWSYSTSEATITTADTDKKANDMAVTFGAVEISFGPWSRGFPSGAPAPV